MTPTTRETQQNSGKGKGWMFAGGFVLLPLARRRRTCPELNSAKRGSSGLAPHPPPPLRAPRGSRLTQGQPWVPEPQCWDQHGATQIL